MGSEVPFKNANDHVRNLFGLAEFGNSGIVRGSMDINEPMSDQVADDLKETFAGRLAFSPQEVADALGVSRQWVFEQIAKGTILSVKLGGKRLIRVAEVERLLSPEEAR